MTRWSGFLAITAVLPALAAATPAPRVVTIAQATDVDSFDPAELNSQETQSIARLIWGTLYRVASDGKLTPYLADSSTLSEDGKAITFKLHPGLKCETGAPLTAADVAYSFDRVVDPKARFTGHEAGFLLPALGYAGAEVVDDATVTIKLKAYNPIALGLIGEMLIHCKAPYEHMTLEEAATHPVGTGPYKLGQWQHDDRVVLVRNENYTLKPPTYDQLVWRIIPEASTRSAELLAGNVDIVSGVAPDQIDAINQSGVAKVEAVASIRRIYIGFNLKPKFADTPGGKAIEDPRVRRALQFAVDVPSICESLLRTPCKRPATMVWPANDKSGLTPDNYDPDRAEKMLDAAGYKRGADGVRFSLTLQAPRGRYLADVNVALAVAQYLSDIGVETSVDPLDYSSTFIPLARTHDLGPLFMMGTSGATWSALYDMADLSAADAGANYANYSDPKFFAGWQKLSETRDPAAQDAIVKDMLTTFRDTGNWLVLYFQPDLYGVSDRIKWQPRADEIISFD